MAFVAHDTAHGHAAHARGVRKTTSNAWVTTTSGQPDVYINHDVLNSGAFCCIESFFGINRESDERLVLCACKCFEAARVEHFICEKEIIADACVNHAEHFARCGTSKGIVASTFLFSGEAGTLVGFDMWS